VTIRCEIASQDRLVYEDDVDIVVVPGLEGEMGILPNHAPLLSLLNLGVIRVRKGGEEQAFIVTGGLVEVQPHIVTILADAAEHVAEIDIARAEEARQRARQLLEEGLPPDADRYLAIEAALRRSNLRLDAVSKYRRSGRTRMDSISSSSGEDN
jgi:F-type H+-transporting ATPase subunit epsilon